MRLEGTLDAFSLPDIFQLLSFTHKTGTLRLRRTLPHGGVLEGVVHVRGGAVTGARSDVRREQLARRLLSTGLVDDEALAQAAEVLADNPAAGLPRLLAERGHVSADAARAVAADHVTDAVFDLLRWPDGEFAFGVDETDPDDLGAALPVEELVAEGRRRVEAWPGIAEQVPAADAVVRLNPVPPEDRAVSAEEWALLALADGRRTVADLVALAGRGEYVVVRALAGLVARGLLLVGAAGEDQAVKRHLLLSALEGVAAPSTGATDRPGDERSTPGGAAPAGRGAGNGQVFPARPDPFNGVRRPDHPEPVPARVRADGGAASAAHGSVHGATAMQPVPAPVGVLERDPSVDRTLLLRLIAGVRGL